MRWSRISCVAIAVIFVTCAARVSAQEPGVPETRSLLGGTVKAAVTDPTTYAPSALLYAAKMLDWKSSQPFFRNGFVENNSRYTVNGLAHDVPVSYEVGKRRILKDALAVVPAMFVNNAASHLIERTLIRRYPEHRKAFRVLGLVERISLSAFVSYRLSSGHFQQWQMNQRLASELGYR